MGHQLVGRQLLELLFSVSDSHLHPRFPEGDSGSDMQSACTRGWRASACHVATSQRTLQVSVLLWRVKYGGGEGTTGLVTEAGEACCHVCSLDPHLGPPSPPGLFCPARSPKVRDTHTCMLSPVGPAPTWGHGPTHRADL